MAVLSRLLQGINETREQAAIVTRIYGCSRFYWSLDMIWCLVRYGARPIDYARFEFYRKSAHERNRYLTIFRYFAVYKKLNAYGIGGGKINEYNAYKGYIRRDWMIVDKNTEEKAIRCFIAKYHTIIAKPNNGEQGKGVMKISENDLSAIKELFELRKTIKFVMEECLENAPEIAAINASSLNTIRCYTFIDKVGKTHILEIMLRVGLAGSHVDNWGSGGVGYVFDKETGICSQYGQDKLNRPYTFHPGSNVQMIGFKLPRFEEMKQYVNSLCSVNPKARYVGWDIAITPNGFDLVEMNCPGGHDFLQAFGTPWGDFIKKNW